jgi:hypothetical protein
VDASVAFFVCAIYERTCFLRTGEVPCAGNRRDGHYYEPDAVHDAEIMRIEEALSVGMSRMAPLPVMPA